MVNKKKKMNAKINKLIFNVYAIEEQNNTTKEKIDYDSDYKDKNKNIVTNFKINNKYKHTSETNKKYRYNMITNRVMRSFSNKNKRKNILFNKDNCNLKIQLNFNINSLFLVFTKSLSHIGVKF